MVKTLVQASCFIASSFNLSTARVYFSACFNPLCPKRLATVLIFAPLFRMFTANKCRAQCLLICLSIPVLFTQCLTDLRQLSYIANRISNGSYKLILTLTYHISFDISLKNRLLLPSLSQQIPHIIQRGRDWLR